MTAGTSQEAYATLHRAYVGPALRSLGFKGSMGRYTADRPDAYVTLGFQRSMFGDRAEALFTINVSVVPIDAWQAARATNRWLPARPAPSAGYGPRLFNGSIWVSRIGLLLPERHDHWWKLTPATDLGALSTEVIAAITRGAMPAIEAQLLQFSSRDIR
jgi:hypothetical protein